jgi:hypothetical protein
MLKEATKPVPMGVFSSLEAGIAAQLTAVTATEEELRFKVEVRESLERMLQSKWGPTLSYLL